MLPVRRADTAQFSPSALQREILLWTTKDGREIPLDEMTDDHISNALRVLMLWRSRVRKRDGDTDIVRELRDAIERFKRPQRQRRKEVPADERPQRRGLSFQKAPGFQKASGFPKAPGFQKSKGLQKARGFQKVRGG